MKKEGSIGTAAVLALATVVGFAVYPGGGNPGSGKANSTSAAAKSSGPRTGPNTKTATPPKTPKPQPWCDDLTERLGSFLKIPDADQIVRAQDCYEPPEPPEKLKTPSQDGNVLKAASRLKFVIALLPDPLHTHLPVLFDEFTGAIQEAGQDEKYEFDSSWLPWLDEEPDYALLTDRQSADHVKSMREKQPGVILFRKAAPLSDHPQPDSLLPEYQNGLVVLVVGEDATHGIHREQFRNALAWIAILDPHVNQRPGAVSILGPTFSGSLPSLAQLLLEPEIRKLWNLSPSDHRAPEAQAWPCAQFAIYSGAVSGASAAQLFRGRFPVSCSGVDRQPQVLFHSFVADDDTLLEQFCEYMKGEQPEFDRSKVAIVSEDETAYGRLANSKKPELKCSSDFFTIFYPRDISALRGAYQTSSIFDSGLRAQPSDSQRRNLPTDLADPAGEVHDSIKTYGGNQTPQVQEAVLLQLVAALRDFHVRYVILRSSNSLDQVFLTNFLRRTYPDGRIVIVGSDLLFSRERGATGLSGTMTLSTYPLSPLARRWMEYPENSSDRVFSSNQSEGTYIALRLLLNSSSDPTPGCHVTTGPSGDIQQIFLPTVTCSGGSPIPDYAAPFWLRTANCPTNLPDPHVASAEFRSVYCGPPTWLSAIGQNKLWPLAAINSHSNRETRWPEKVLGDPAAVHERNDGARGRRPEMPLVMKVFWLLLVAFAAFRAWCCWFGSLTARPAFLAQYAAIGGPQQEALLFIGSCLVVLLAVVAAYGCAAFSPPAYALIYPWFALAAGGLICALAAFSTIATSVCGCRLSRGRIASAPGSQNAGEQNLRRWRSKALLNTGALLGAVLLFTCLTVWPIYRVARPANQLFASWRGMNLLSGLSWLVPLLAMLGGLYVAGWFVLHGFALLGEDRPLLPLRAHLRLPFDSQEGLLSMFSQESAQLPVEELCQPRNRKVLILAALLIVTFLLVAGVTVGGFPIRSMGPRNYSAVVVGWWCICASLLLAETWRLYVIWGDLRILLVFLDRLPLRRTLGALHGFSWGSVWKMSGNVLEVRYKFLSRQIECLNHTIASIKDAVAKGLDPWAEVAARECALSSSVVVQSVYEFANWYAAIVTNPDAGNLEPFHKLQANFAEASGRILAKLLVPYWMSEGVSLTHLPASADKSEAGAPDIPAPAKDLYIQNAEEFVCLNYLAFVQNILGNIRTVTITVIVLFLAVAIAISSYPFDPRQGLSGILVLLLAIMGFVIVSVYAGMYRDATLSHVTNTRPGELGSEFWFKLIGFGFAPVLGLLARIFPSITDFLFSWLQPSISALK
jgi:hypothetical protein